VPTSTTHERVYRDRGLNCLRIKLFESCDLKVVACIRGHTGACNTYSCHGCIKLQKKLNEISELEEI
jgi:hypothetical protein